MLLLLLCCQLGCYVDSSALKYQTLPVIPPNSCLTQQQKQQCDMHHPLRGSAKTHNPTCKCCCRAWRLHQKRGAACHALTKCSTRDEHTALRTVQTWKRPAENFQMTYRPRTKARTVVHDFAHHTTPHHATPHGTTQRSVVEGSRLSTRHVLNEG